MWSTLKISSGAQLGHNKRDIPAFDTVLIHSNLSSLRRKYLSDVPTDKIVLSSGAKISKRPLKRGHWWPKNKERKCHFRFVVRRFLAAINCTGSAEGALVPVLLRITHWTKSGLPVSPPGLFPPWDIRIKPFSMELNGQDCGDRGEMISFLCRRSSKDRHGCVWRLSPEGHVEF